MVSCYKKNDRMEKESVMTAREKEAFLQNIAIIPVFIMQFPHFYLFILKYYAHLFQTQNTYCLTKDFSLGIMKTEAKKHLSR